MPEEFSDFEKANAIRSAVLEAAAQVQFYSDIWQDNFSVTHITSVFTRLRNQFGEVQVGILYEEEMIALGFRKWSEGLPIYLIPAYLFPFLPVGEHFISITGEEILFDPEETDEDSRAGCLSFGLYPAQPEHIESIPTGKRDIELND